jgi:hypothetical protein
MSALLGGELRRESPTGNAGRTQQSIWPPSFTIPLLLVCFTLSKTIALFCILVNGILAFASFLHDFSETNEHADCQQSPDVNTFAMSWPRTNIRSLKVSEYTCAR